MLHRDISLNNILLYHPLHPEQSSLRRGLLIDFDYALQLDKKRTEPPPENGPRRTVRHSVNSLSMPLTY